MALIVTIIGFFASLKFYRDGVQMQARADRVLAKIEERASAIQSQVGGMFDKTLDAALGRSTPREAERQQSRILASTPEEPGEPAVPIAQTGLASNSELAQKTAQFYAFRKMRITDVKDPTARAVFNLGSPGGFNLLDGTGGLLFLGFFADLEAVQIVARVRILFNNLEISYTRLADPALDPSLRDQAKRLLDQIAVDLLVLDSLDTNGVTRKIDEYQPKERRIAVAIRTPMQIAEAVAGEFRQMEP